MPKPRATADRQRERLHKLLDRVIDCARSIAIDHKVELRGALNEYRAALQPVLREYNRKGAPKIWMQGLAAHYVRALHVQEGVRMKVARSYVVAEYDVTDSAVRNWVQIARRRQADSVLKQRLAELEVPLDVSSCLIYIKVFGQGYRETVPLSQRHRRSHRSQ
jgi:transposase-like protein